MLKTVKKVVLASGVFDILHLGHIFYLEESKKLGNELYVLLARDKTVKRKKGKPFNDENIRKKILESLRCVDKVVLGNEDFGNHQFDIIRKINPAIMTIGFDQPFKEKLLEEKILAETGKQVQVKRVRQFKGKFNKTSHNIRKIYHYHKKKNA